MDDALKQLIDEAGDAIELDLQNIAAGSVVLQGANGAQTYTLKPLQELYGTGTGAETLDPESDEFMPLMLRIEEDIAAAYQNRPAMTDGQVLLSLKPLAMAPEADVNADPLALRIQGGLRLVLSMNNYSRQDVKMALKKIVKSVERHTRMDGVRGYLGFILEYFGKR